MSREWKPGDVAMVLNEWGVWNRAICAARSGHRGFVWSYGVADSVSPLSAEARPLVVIDPEDAEQVRGLWHALLVHMPVNSPEVLAEALREFANPTPRVEEPTGLGAVVEDSDGDVWARRRNGLWEDLSGPPGDCRPWASLHERYGPLTILSHGVSPEDAS